MPGPFTPRKPNLSKGELARRRRVFFAALAAAAAEGDKDNSGGGTPAEPVLPSDLSDLEIWLGIDSYTYALDAGLEVVTGNPVNLAVGGSAMTMLANTLNHPYIMHEDMTFDNPGTGPATVALPNGQKVMASIQATIDSGISANHTNIEHDVATPFVSADVSCIWVFFMHSHSNLGSQRNLMQQDGGSGWSVFNIGGNCNSTFSDTSGNYVIRNGSAAEIGDAWHILTWRKTNLGFQMALDGVEYTDLDSPGNSRTATGNMQSGVIWKNTQLTTFWPEYCLYSASHSMEDLDTVASELATKYGITYLYTPAP